MKKNLVNYSGRGVMSLLNLNLLKMKLTLLCLLIGSMQLFASQGFSQSQTLSLNLRDVTVEKALLDIEQQSNLYFIYSREDVDVARKVNISVSNEKIGEVLNKIFAGTNVGYQIQDRHIILTSSHNLLSQGKRPVSGRITDSTGAPLPGVTVVIKGTTQGTISDADGKYQMAGVPADAVLVFSFVGMKTQEINSAGKIAIDVTMREESVGLDEVVAIGYGTTTKRKAVGAISTVDAEKLEHTPYPNVGQALQGQVPGLIVKNSGGAPGSTPTISIRGGGDPLYVIDGVITTQEDFNSLNSDDIQSISFLKDASATAVYGSRAGNGIVLVTTKRGKEGKLSVNYSYNYQLSQPTVMPAEMNSYQFATVQNAANAYEGTPPTYTADQLNMIKNHTNLDAYPDNNWVNMALKKFATEQRHNLSLTGGDKHTDYFVSLGYIDQGGIIKTDVVNYQRMNIRSNMTTHFDDIGLEIGVNVNASLQNYREPYVGMYSLWRAINQNTQPLYRGYNLDGTLAGGGDGDNPMALIDKNEGYNRTRDKFINAQLSARWQVPGVKGLKLGVMANYRDGDGWDKSWQYNTPLYMQDGSLALQVAPALSISSYYNKRMYFESSANYARNFGKHGVEATFVYNQTTSSGETLSASRRDFQSGAVDQLFAGSTIGKDNNGNETEAANAGYVFRVKYDYNYKYIAEFSGRYDGNDNFAPDQRWGFFPATSLAWNVSEEGFMGGLKDRNIVDQLKLRFSYGETGVTQGVNRFGYIPVYNLEPSTYDVGGNLVNGYSEGPLVNPEELTWYTRSSLNYGIDFSTLKNRLSGTADYFYYRTTGFLMSPQNVYSEPLGKALPQIKSNSAQRRAGYEISLRYKDHWGELSYNIGLNYSYFNQLWEELDTEDEATLKNPYTRETHRTDYWQGGLVYLAEGLYQNDNEILNSPRLLASSEMQGGDIRYRDMNGDGKIDDQDKRLIGKPSFPHSNYGIDFSLNYKGWSLSGLFQGTGNRYLAFDHFMIGEAKRLTYQYQLNYWRPDNPNALYPRAVSSVSVNGGNNDVQTNPSDFFIKNAKYFRLKNIQIGYDFKRSLLAKTPWIASCRAFINGTNLLTISPVKAYFDPEQAEAGDGSDSGTQTYGYPVQRTYSFGINVGF